MQPNIIRPYNPIVLFNIVPMYRPGLQEIYEYGRSEGYINGQYKAAYTIPNLACRIKQNTLYKGLEGVAGAGLSAEMDQLLIFASDGGDSNFATINWVDPSIRQATKVGAIAYTNKLGFTTSATTYLNTNWIANTANYTQNNAGFGIYINTESAVTTGIDCGVISGSRLHQIYSRRGDNTINFSITSVSTANVVHGSSRGLWHVKRTGASACAAFKNGAEILSSTIASNGVMPTVSFFIGGRNNAGVLQEAASRQYGMFWGGANLDGQEAALDTAWNTYFTSL